MTAIAELLIIDEQESPSELGRRYAGCAAARAPVDDQFPRPRRRDDDPPQDAERFLRGISGALARRRRHDGVPPDVGGQFAARRALGGLQARRHVRLSRHIARVEVIAARIADVDEDDVVLCGPATFRPRTIVVCPHHLVEKALATEDLVEQHLAVVRLARIDVEIEAAVRGEDSPCLDEPRPQPSDVIVETIVEPRAVRSLRPIVTARETEPRQLRVLRRRRSQSVTLTAGVERRIDVDEAGTSVRQRAKDVECLAVHDGGGRAGRVGAGSLRRHVQ